MACLNMDMPRIKSAYWKYRQEESFSLFDPRTHISRHIAWQRTGEETHWTGVEPDNYNYAIFDNKPHDIKFIKDQCWYKVNEVFRTNKIQGWVSAYVIDTKEDIFLFNRELLIIQPQAVWRYDKSQPLRPKRTQLQRERTSGKRADYNLTTEERLYQMGYYEKLETKYFDDEIKFKVNLGTLRGVVQVPYYLDDNEDETDYCDN